MQVSRGCVVTQRFSQTRPDATDFRRVHASVNANGVGTLLAGIAGTLLCGAGQGLGPAPPGGDRGDTAHDTLRCVHYGAHQVHRGRSAPCRVGYALGAILLLLAFLPKTTALLIGVPPPVAGAFLILIMGFLFVDGMRMIFQDGLDHRKALVAGLSFSVGVGFGNQNVLVDALGETRDTILGNSTTSGVLIAISMTVFMTVFLRLASPRHTRLDTTLAASAAPEIDAFLRVPTSKARWNDASTDRLRAADEETLSCLLRSDNRLRTASEEGGPEAVESADAQSSARRSGRTASTQTSEPPEKMGGGGESDGVPRLTIVARPGDGVESGLELEFMAVFDEENI